MDPKARPNHARYLAILRGMTPEERLRQAFALTDFSRELLLAGLRRRFPDKSDAEIRALYLERIALCRSRSS